MTRDQMSVLNTILIIVFIISIIAFIVTLSVKEYDFKFGCQAYIDRAIVASDLDVAQAELGKAIDYMEQHSLTEGIVSIILKNPKNDIGYWYNTIKDTHRQIMEFPRDATQLEKSNFMMRVRESIEGLSTPSWIFLYPHNTLWLVWGIISFFGVAIAFALKSTEKYSF